MTLWNSSGIHICMYTHPHTDIPHAPCLNSSHPHLPASTPRPLHMLFPPLGKPSHSSFRHKHLLFRPTLPDQFLPHQPFHPKGLKSHHLAQLKFDIWHQASPNSPQEKRFSHLLIQCTMRHTGENREMESSLSYKYPITVSTMDLSKHVTI